MVFYGILITVKGTWCSTVAQQTFNLSGQGSNPCVPTKNKNRKKYNKMNKAISYNYLSDFLVDFIENKGYIFCEIISTLKDGWAIKALDQKEMIMHYFYIDELVSEILKQEINEKKGDNKNYGN